jgi:hypothetical protein
MGDVKFYGKIISTADSRPYVVCEKVFNTEAEAKAYILGCKDGICEADPESEDLYAMYNNELSEDE